MIKRLLPMQRSSKITKKFRPLRLAFLAIFLLAGFWGAVNFAAPTLAPLGAAPVLAAEGDQFGLNTAANLSAGGSGSVDLMTMITNIVRIIFGLLGVIAVLLIMYAGFIYMTAAGDADKVKKAKEILKNAIIGLIIIFSAFAIASFVINLLAGAGGNGPNPNPPGPTPIIDPGRWGIGRGPIESVFPAPGQQNVFIDVSVMVTFKEAIDPTTLCDVSAGAQCAGQIMKNVEICELTDQDVCVAGGETFGTTAFARSTVTQTGNNRTFVFHPSVYLGAQDGRARKFQVVLQSGIHSVAEPDKSIFDSLVSGEYKWNFSTNGRMDLNPPQILNAGVYPDPDDTGDTYRTVTPPAAASFDFSRSGMPAAAAVASYTQPADPAPEASVSATVSGNYTGSGSGEVTVTILSGAGTITTIWPGATEPFVSAAAYDNGSVLNIGPYGLIFTLAGQADINRAGNNVWKFNVQAPATGDKIELLKSGSVIKTYVWGTDIPATGDVRKNVRDKIVADNPAIFQLCDGGSLYCVRTKATGSAANDYEIKSSSAAITVARTPGADAGATRQIVGRPDAYRNTIFQINFNKPINPVSLEGSLKVRRGDSGTQVPDFTVEFSNQYQTVELRGPDECGQNSCGDKIFCWLVSGDTERYEVEIIASSLMFSALGERSSVDSRCAQWGGADSNDLTNRCFKIIDSRAVYFPKAAEPANGIADVSNNSFNGGFNSYQDNQGQPLGLANGRSDGGAGDSKLLSYYLNAAAAPYGPRDDYGDNFRWSFYVSGQIDTQSPVMETVNPVGDEQTNDLNQNVEFVFDRVMRSATIKPGWNYGTEEKEKTTRYLVLETLGNATPVGYWASKVNLDINGDGWADKTVAALSHNRFDQFAKYGPLAGSGLQSLTQNCFLPGAGPDKAGSGAGGICHYDENGYLVGCGGDAAGAVRPPNPVSYGYLNCEEITDAKLCEDPKKICKPLYQTDDAKIGGSWVITKDKSTADPAGRTGCCLGRCELPE